MRKELYIPQNDEAYSARFVDVDETRTRITPYGNEISFRYVHGGFKNTNVKFSLCLPEKGSCEGRIFHYLNPSPAFDEEMRLLSATGEADQISFCLLNKSCFLESNMGAIQSAVPMADPQIVWKSSAQVMLFAKDIVKAHCGATKVFGYVHGGSGGGYKTMACVENTDGVFDGALPYVIGSPLSLPNTITMHALGQRVLRNCFDKIYKNIDAGGSGNPYDGLSETERKVLRELTFMGFPPLAWFYEAKGIIDDGALPVISPVVRMTDPTYFDDFWNKQGYEGFENVYNAQNDRLVFNGIVKSVHLPENPSEKLSYHGVDSAWKNGVSHAKEAYIELESLPQGEDLYLKGVNIIPTSGDAVGSVLRLENIVKTNDGGEYILLGASFGTSDIPETLSKLKPGDSVLLDNSDYIAVQYYYRHQAPQDPSFKAWDQFRDKNGEPALPQRAFIMGYGFSGTGTVQDGDIHCKTINLQSLMDESTCPWCADWYRKKVEEKGKLSDFRTYYMERTMHGDYDCPQTNLNVSYIGAKRQALLDLAAWAEKGIEPLPSTEYEMKDNQPVVSKSAKERKGLQPTVSFTANGADFATVKKGEYVEFSVSTEMPKGAGKITHIAVDFFDRDVKTLRPEFELELPVDENGGVSFKKSFDTVGEYFVSVMVKAQRNGDPNDFYTQIKNLARVKVVVK